MVDCGDGKKSNTYGPPGSRHHVNQGLKQQQQQQQHFHCDFIFTFLLAIYPG